MRIHVTAWKGDVQLGQGTAVVDDRAGEAVEHTVRDLLVSIRDDHHRDRSSSLRDYRITLEPWTHS